MLHIILHVEIGSILLYKARIYVSYDFTVIAGQEVLRRVIGVGTVLILPKLHHRGLIVIGVEQPVRFRLFHIVLQVVQQPLIGKAGDVRVRNPDNIQLGAGGDRLRDTGFVSGQLRKFKVHIRIDDDEPGSEVVHQFLLLGRVEHRDAERGVDFGVDIPGNVIVRILQFHIDRAALQPEYARRKKHCGTKRGYPFFH